MLCITVLTAHADSGRTQVESFIGGYIEHVEQSGRRFLSNDDPKKYISAWSQFSQERLVLNKKDPTKIAIGFFAGTKWAVASSSPRETVVINVGQSVLNDPPSDPNTIVGIMLVFETRQIPGKGWKIIVDESDGSAVIKKKEVLTWREYSSRGYKEAIDRVYSGESSARTLDVQSRSNTSSMGRGGLREMVYLEATKAYAARCNNGSSDVFERTTLGQYCGGSSADGFKCFSTPSLTAQHICK